MITRLVPKCVCGRSLAALEGGDAATFLARRTCRKCGIVWLVAVDPAIQLGHGARAHRVELTVLKAERKARQ